MQPEWKNSPDKFSINLTHVSRITLEKKVAKNNKVLSIDATVLQQEYDDSHTLKVQYFFECQFKQLSEDILECIKFLKAEIIYTAMTKEDEFLAKYLIRCMRKDIKYLKEYYETFCRPTA